MDEEYVVCALLHDMGDILASANHAELGATVLRPFVSEENWWMLHHHGIFQGYYFFHRVSRPRQEHAASSSAAFIPRFERTRAMLPCALPRPERLRSRL